MMAYSPFKGMTKKQQKSLRNVVIAGGVGFLLYQFFGDGGNGNGKRPLVESHDVEKMEVFYTEKASGEVVSKSVRNGDLLDGRQMALQLRFTPTGSGTTYVRVNYTTYKDSDELNRYTRVVQVAGGTVGKFTIEPHNYDTIPLGANRVQFNIEVLPPSTGGVPRAGYSYPTYRFDYRL